MALWKLVLSYDGTFYNGWQVQPNLPTIQGTLASAIQHVSGETVLPQGSGRTDTGVHALAQVASFEISAPIPAANLLRALNRALPPSIRVLSVEAAAPDFHARHSARQKTYEYRIFPRVFAGGRHERICPPMLAPYAWDCPWPLDLARLQRASADVVGEHDFTSFAANDPELAARSDAAAQPQGNTRTVFSSVWNEDDGLYTYRITGSGFLHHMVRNIVGTFVDIGAHRAPADALPRILAARNRSAAGPTAPARGLFLVDVEY